MRRLVLLLLLSLPCAAGAADYIGLWVGWYAYDNGSRVECAMVLEQVGDAIGGAMVERQTFGDEVLPGLPADLVGEVEGNGIVFEKHYFHDEDGAEPVVYHLMLSPNGHMLSGFWKLGELQGTATFRRVTAASAERIPPP